MTRRRDPSPKCVLLGTVESRAQMYRERLLLTQQRLLRSELFVLKGMGNTSLTTKHSSSNHAPSSVRNYRYSAFVHICSIYNIMLFVFLLSLFLFYFQFNIYIYLFSLFPFVCIFVCIVNSYVQSSLSWAALE